VTAEYNIYWGDMHCQFKPQWSRNEWDAFIERSFVAARDYLDFYPVVYYPAVYYHTEPGLKVESIGMRPEFQPEWEKVCALVKKYHEPGRFVTFCGYEWTGDRTRWGDHNVFYPDDDPPLDLSMTIDELYANLKKRKGIAIPHHTGYAKGERGKDWDHWDEDVSPFAEIFSVHGSSEGCNTPIGLHSNVSMGPRVSGGTIQDGLARGYRLGIIASGDNANGFPGRYGVGLVACCAKELTREAIWDAFMARRVYGVTGDRIKLDFRINGRFMGETFRARPPLRVTAHVTGTQAIDRIELIRNNRVIYTHCHNGTWDIPTGDNVRAKLRILHGGGPASNYGFKVSAKNWKGGLTVADARIISVEGCFTRCGQTIKPVSDTRCDYALTTSPRGGSATPAAEFQQAVVFEIEGSPSARIRLQVDEIDQTFTLREAMETSRVFPMMQQVRRNIQHQFGLDVDQIENPEDVSYHNAYKVKVHLAVPAASYDVPFEFVDDNPPPGRNFYYIRVSQLNGHLAWSSPIWVEI